MAKKLTYSTWLLSWDCNGLEAVINVDDFEDQNTEYDQKVMWDTLSAVDMTDVTSTISPAARLSHTISGMMLRARYNPQRHYEIYSVGMPSGVDKEDIMEMFEGKGAQVMVDLIREKGTKYFSDRAQPEKVLIV